MAITKKSAASAPAGNRKKATNATARNASAKKATATKKASSKKSTSKKSTSKAATKTASRSPAAHKTSSSKAAPSRDKAPAHDKKTKDPKGGLTEAGRKYFAKTEGSHLRPGVQGPADTPDKQKRKGSFLRRHFANPRGPMEKDGKPTRLALSAQAWGEPLPKTAADARKLAAKGKKLLEQYQSSKAGSTKK